MASARFSVVCEGPPGSGWSLEVRDVLSEVERTSFTEYDLLYRAAAKATGHPVGFEIRRVMARVAADYMMACIQVDCSAGAVLLGPSFSKSFTVVLTDSTRVQSLRMLFFDAPLETNTKVWDTSKGQMVDPCGALRLARDRTGCIACAVAFPHRSIGELRRVARLTFNGERR